MKSKLICGYMLSKRREGEIYAFLQKFFINTGCRILEERERIFSQITKIRVECAMSKQPTFRVNINKVDLIVNYRYLLKLINNNRLKT